jgi:hypothetical protein
VPLALLVLLVPRASSGRKVWLEPRALLAPLVLLASRASSGCKVWPEPLVLLAPLASPGRRV